MKTNIFLISSLIISLSVLTTSCDDDGDTTPPIINLTAPAAGAILKIGSESGIHFEAEFTDDEMLASYQVEIHNNIENPHDHSKADATEGEEAKYFSFKQDWDLSGKRNATIHHHDIKIPANTIPGSYHLIVYCTDAAGNETHIARNIILSLDGEEHEH